MCYGYGCIHENSQGECTKSYREVCPATSRAEEQEYANNAIYERNVDEMIEARCCNEDNTDIDARHS